jgi:hypothetical protein
LVDQTDELAARANKSGFVPVAIDNVYDFNRDRRVSASDELTARYLATTEANALRLITLASGGAALAAMADASGATGVSPVQTKSISIDVSTAVTTTTSGGAASPSRSGVTAVRSAHDAALASASWLWAYGWAEIGPRRSPVKKAPAAVSAVDQVLATQWV